MRSPSRAVIEEREEVCQICGRGAWLDLISLDQWCGNAELAVAGDSDPPLQRFMAMGDVMVKTFLEA